MIRLRKYFSKVFEIINTVFALCIVIPGLIISLVVYEDTKNQVKRMMDEKDVDQLDFKMNYLFREEDWTAERVDDKVKLEKR